MSRKSKINPIEKVKIVERYLNGEIGIRQAGRELGADHTSIQSWVSIYKSKGPVGLLDQSQNSHYSKKLKLSAINDYLNEKGSLSAICTKYGIRSKKQLIDWIKVYNSGGILKISTGGSCMKKAKLTTLDERLKIVTECLANDKNYGAIAMKYQCSYQQVILMKWIRKCLFQWDVDRKILIKVIQNMYETFVSN
ncbi:helix-turn-helix domain-containing protein [Brotaphodocola sp.]|uniref:helix-turn-helix domain-containing protein n=1 Tax=Brotaphodocola sp. TaxID=3073577 RepID=UPI003D7C8B39